MADDPACKCGHARSSHHRERVADKDLGVETWWHNCLARWCPCKRYQPPPPPTKRR